MSEKERQSTDSKQGGEGTNSFHNKGYEALTVNIGKKLGQGEAPVPAKDTGTK
jgi:hypothetical protein